MLNISDNDYGTLIDEAIALEGGEPVAALIESLDTAPDNNAAVAKWIEDFDEDGSYILGDGMNYIESKKALEALAADFPALAEALGQEFTMPEIGAAGEAADKFFDSAKIAAPFTEMTDEDEPQDLDNFDFYPDKFLNSNGDKNTVLMWHPTDEDVSSADALGFINYTTSPGVGVRIHETEVRDKGIGHGTQMMDEFEGSLDEPAIILESKDSATPFWEGRGYEQYDNEFHIPLMTKVLVATLERGAAKTAQYAGDEVGVNYRTKKKSQSNRTDIGVVPVVHPNSGLAYNIELYSTSGSGRVVFHADAIDSETGTPVGLTAGRMSLWDAFSAAVSSLGINPNDYINEVSIHERTSMRRTASDTTDIYHLKNGFIYDGHFGVQKYDDSGISEVDDWFTPKGKTAQYEGYSEDAILDEMYNYETPEVTMHDNGGYTIEWQEGDLTKTPDGVGVIDRIDRDPYEGDVYIVNFGGGNEGYYSAAQLLFADGRIASAKMSAGISGDELVATTYPNSLSGLREGLTVEWNGKPYRVLSDNGATVDVVPADAYNTSITYEVANKSDLSVKTARPAKDAPKSEHDKWKRAIKAVEESKGKSESEFTSRDWGLVTYISKGIKSAAKTAQTKYMFDDKEIVWIVDGFSGASKFTEDGYTLEPGTPLVFKQSTLAGVPNAEDDAIYVYYPTGSNSYYPSYDMPDMFYAEDIEAQTRLQGSGMSTDAFPSEKAAVRWAENNSPIGMLKAAQQTVTLSSVSQAISSAKSALNGKPYTNDFGAAEVKAVEQLIMSINDTDERQKAVKMLEDFIAWIESYQPPMATASRKTAQVDEPIEYFAAQNPRGEWAIYLSDIYGETMVRACATEQDAVSLANAMNDDLGTVSSEELVAANNYFESLINKG